MATKAPKYTREDMKTLAQMSAEGSVPGVYLEELDYDPARFRELLEQHNLGKDVFYLFEYPHEDLGLLVNDSKLNGYLKFRLTVDK